MDRPETGGEVVARSLVEHGISTLFAIPGVQLDPIFAGLFDERDSLRVIHARHEQGVALMAFGYSHVTRRPGALLVVPGPGFLNATTGILVAHACNTPLLCLVGQNERRFIGSGYGVLHELDDQIGIAATMTKWVARVEDEARLGSVLAEAFDHLFDHRQRPVYVELPTDVVRMPVPDAPLPVSGMFRKLPSVSEEEVHRVARALASAEFPLLMAGGGVTHARRSLQALAELLGAPVGMSENGLGSLDCRHPLAFTQLGANRLWEKADCVLALGTRLYAPVFNWGFDDELCIYKVDIDAGELNRLPVPVNGIEAECDDFLQKLLKVLPEYLNAPKALGSELQAVREEVTAQLLGMDFHRQFLEAIREELGEQGILVVDVTQMNHACLDMLPVYEPRTYISSGYQGALGFGPCTALGAKVGKPGVPVACLTGDGGFMYAAQELATAVQFDIPVVMIVINDGAYRNVQNLLNDMYGGRAIATTLVNPDFVKFADSFNVPARSVTSISEMQTTLKEAFASGSPWLIDYQVEEVPSAFWLRFLPQVRKHKPENDFGLSDRQL